MSGITWLASYPKSGNTWLRLFLANYFYSKDQPININEFHVGGPIASSRDLLDNALGVEISELTSSELEAYRPRAYEYITAGIEDPYFCKIHDALTLGESGVLVISKLATARVIYLIRNPCAVAVSFANHIGSSLDQTIKQMANPAFQIGFVAAEGQLPQYLLTWSQHVKSWVDEPDLSVHVVRYEDMKLSPAETFSAILQACNLEVDTVQLQKAIEFTHFDVLQAQEQEQGFKEKPIKASAFFRKGDINSWREELSAEQIDRIIQAHGDEMQRFGYLQDDGQTVC